MSSKKRASSVDDMQIPSFLDLLDDGEEAGEIQDTEDGTVDNETEEQDEEDSESLAKEDEDLEEEDDAVDEMAANEEVDDEAEDEDEEADDDGGEDDESLVEEDEVEALKYAKVAKTKAVKNVQVEKGGGRTKCEGCKSGEDQGSASFKGGEGEGC